MPSYFYHIAFELSAEPRSSVEDTRPVYIPPPGTRLFSTPLPTHSVASWKGDLPSGRAHRRARTTSLDGHRPSNITDGIVNLPVKPTSRLEETNGWRDWRKGPVTIQSIEMEPQDNIDGRPRGKSQTQDTAPVTTSRGLATRGRFVPSDPRNTEVGWGVVHLYRDLYQTPGLYDDGSSSTGSEVEGEDFAFFNEEQCTTLCILAVPSYMTPSDLLGFVGEQARDDVSHFRLIRTGKANKYMVLMKFREARAAKAFRKEYDGKHFNSMDSEYCHVVYVASITFQSNEETNTTAMPQSSFPDMSNDPFTPTTPAMSGALETVNGGTLPSPGAPVNVSTKPLAPPTPALVELPTCPVCLERMDETTGLLTILCQHVFHCNCLEKWRGSGCPVCRYTQNASGMPRRRGADDDDQSEDMCSVCGADANLWICLICGNVGCGRYDEAHAFAHYEATGHSYAMDIQTQHVWDYVGDGYVHRLITNKADGKIVDLPAANGKGTEKDYHGGMVGYGADMVPREKMDAMGNEYAYLLTSQLDSQRRYFEEQLERAVDKAAKAAATADKAAASLESLTASLDRLQKQHKDAQSQLESLAKESERSQRRAQKADELARRFTKSYQEEKTVNDSLLERIRHLDGKIKDADDKVHMLEEQKRDLEDQNRDLSFFISGQAKLKELEEQGEEIAEGSVEVPEVQGTGKKKKKGRKK